MELEWAGGKAHQYGVDGTTDDTQKKNIRQDKAQHGTNPRIKKNSTKVSRIPS